MEKINNFLKKIRSKYILKQIFDNLKENKLLEIIRYNKNIQNKLNKKLIDFIKEYSKIVIEIIPKENEFGKFISIPKRYESYYHIYFDDNKEEIKKKRLIKNENIFKIKVILDYKIKSLYNLFYNCKCIKKISFIKFKRKDIVDMRGMFCGCSSLEKLDLSNFNTINVTKMDGMFGRCLFLNELNLSNFNTNKVTDMNHMFYFCS